MNTANFESIHIMIDAQVWRNLPLHVRLYHAFRQLVISGALVDGANCRPLARWRSSFACPEIRLKMPIPSFSATAL